MLIAFSVAPSGAAAENPAGSVHDAVAAAVTVVRESGLRTARPACSPRSKVLTGTP